MVIAPEVLDPVRTITDGGEQLGIGAAADAGRDGHDTGGARGDIAQVERPAADIERTAAS